MRILHVSSSMTWQGGEQQVAYLSEILILKGHQQWILCPQDSAMDTYCQKSNIPHFTYRKIAAANPLVGKKIELLSCTYNIQIVHLHDPHSHTYGCLAASIFKMKVPIILSRRVDFPLRQNPLSKWKYNHAAIDKIICVSNFIKTVMLPDIVDQSKLTVIHSGIDLNRFSKAYKSILHKEFQLSDQTIIVANIAEITVDKDYITFVKTAESLLQKNEQLHFFIIGGDGGEADEIKTLITEKNLQEKITLTGYRKDISQLLPEIDIFLSTSIREGLGISLLDAQLCEVPVVATQVGGIPEIISHGKTGLLAPAEQPEKLVLQVERLIKNKTLRSSLTKNALKSVQSFSKEMMAEKTIAVYNEVLAQT